MKKSFVKLAQRVNFTNIYMQLFLKQISKAQRNTYDLYVFLRFWDLQM